MTDFSAMLKRTGLQRIDPVWLAMLALLALVALFDNAYFGEAVSFTIRTILGTAPFILFAVVAVAYLKATGAEHLVARAFEGPQMRMIVMAALLGGLSPFCSCQVIPFIAAMLALGVPLSAVMAFWLASPLMDPAMFLITAGTLGIDFAIAKTVAAVATGLLGGVLTMQFAHSRVFANPLRADSPVGGCCGTKRLGQGQIEWAFWKENSRVAVFRETAWENAYFLLKWLLLAYLIEALMLRYIPAEVIGTWLGGEGVGPIILASLVGAPAYLNGYAAVPLVDALMTQGMSDGAAMSFVIAGGVSCIPAALAVWALVKPRVFFAYIGFAFLGAVLAGIVWNILA